ncbi:MAG: 50S ribosomal protein L4 [Clostridia bacterium]|nr:50S ribosomal protein L4 [Clostridia bacterium]
MKSKLYDMSAKEIGEIELPENVFDVAYNEPLIHEVVVAYNANQRQGTKSTLTRSEVRGHAKKPYRQKHTGRARHGSTKSPEYKGGGVVFAPKPRDYSKKLNKQVKRIAFASALSAKLAQNDIIFIDEFKLDAPKTKEVQKFLDAFKIENKAVIVTDAPNADGVRAANNIADVKLQIAELLSTYDVVANKTLVLTKNAVKSLEEAYN